VEFQGQPVTDLQKFRLKVADTPVGTKVNLVVLRDGRRVPISVTLTPRKQDQVAQSVPGGGGGEEEERLAGVRVRDLSTDERQGLNVDSGVMITDVLSGSAADEVGLQSGDVVEEVGGKAASSSKVFAGLIADAKKAGKKHAVLLVRRGEASSFVPVKISE
jgi:serine protease Do